MRFFRIAIIALVVIALSEMLLGAQIGQMGCPYDCRQLIDTTTGQVVDSYCRTVSSGEYLTCKRSQWCWYMPIVGWYCNDPGCDGETCMYV